METTFGDLLKQLRRRVGMTQAELAAAVNLSVAQVSRLEKNERLPHLDAVAQQFVPALGLQDEPRLVRRLLELAARARGEQVPAAITLTRESRYVVPDQDVAGHIGGDAAAPPNVQTLARSPIPSDEPYLPALPTRMIGRERELEQVSSRLLDGKGRLLTLLGPPGIGKTTLGLAVAELVQDLFRHGAIFVALAPITDPEEVASAILSALHVAAGSKLSAPRTQLIGYLRRKQILLLLDNFEQVTPAAALVAELLAACPELHVLVTSREPLRLRAERRYRMPPLNPAPAIELFAERAQATEADFTLSNDNAALIAQICRQLDYLPLAIELVAARVDIFALPELVAATEENQLRLAESSATDLPDHQQTLRRAIERSYLLLNAGEQRLFRMLGLFAGGCDLAAIQAIQAAMLSGSPESLPKGGAPVLPDAIALVNSLVNRSLVYTSSQAGGAVRFHLLETIRAYALEQLTTMQELPRARMAHAHYYQRLLAQAEQLPRGALPWWTTLVEDYENLRTALRWLLQAAPTLALQLAIQLHAYWEARGQQREGSRWLEQALAQYPQPDSLRAQGLLKLGILAQQQSDHRRATQHLNGALAILQELGDEACLSETARALGWLAADMNDRAGAIRWFEAVLTIARRRPDRPMLARTLADLVHVMGDPRDYAQARAYALESLALFRELEDGKGIAYALRELGLNETRVGNYAAAATYHSEALLLWRQLQAPRDVAWQLEITGESVWHLGDVAGAQRYWQEALQLFQTQEIEFGVLLILHHLGQVARVQGDAAQAAQHYGRSLQICWQLQDMHMSSRCLAGLGGVAALLGNSSLAAQLLAAAYHLFAKLPPFLAPADQCEYDALVAAVPAPMDAAEFAAAWARGEQMPLEQVVASGINLQSLPTSGS